MGTSQESGQGPAWGEGDDRGHEIDHGVQTPVDGYPEDEAGESGVLSPGHDKQGQKGVDEDEGEGIAAAADADDGGVRV
jgi:hypothetical protein